MWIMGAISDVKILDAVQSIHVGILFDDLWMETHEAVTFIRVLEITSKNTSQYTKTL